MKLKQLAILASILLIAISANAQITDKKNKKTSVVAFPQATASQNQVIIDLPAKATLRDEENYKIELIPGIRTQVDCNKHGLDGTLEENTLEGYGYNYYTFKTSGNIWSTKMACPDDSKHEEFVSAKSLILDYNSRIPLVVYLPAGYEVQYRIWKAGKIIDPNKKTSSNKNTDNKLLGEWVWLSSSGGKSIKETTAKSSGINRTLKLNKDGSFIKYEDGAVKSSGKYKLIRESSILNNKKVPMLELSTDKIKISYKFKGRDTLILTEECTDCFKHTYIRKK